MTNQFRVPSLLPRRLKELGLSPEGVLRQAGLPMGLFNQEKILVSRDEFFALYRGIAGATDDPGFGLKLGTEDRVERYDPIQIAALSARSSRDALQRVARYKRLTFPAELRLVERGKECAVQFVWLQAHEKGPALLVDVCFASIVAIGSRSVGRPLRPTDASQRLLTSQVVGNPESVSQIRNGKSARVRPFRPDRASRFAWCLHPQRSCANATRLSASRESDEWRKSSGWRQLVRTPSGATFC